MTENFLLSLADYPFDIEQIEVSSDGRVTTINCDLLFSRHVRECDVVFPDNLIINGDVTVDGMGIVRFGDGITINGSLKINNCCELDLSNLPNVSYRFIIIGTRISSLQLCEVHFKSSFEVVRCKFLSSSSLPSKIVCDGDFIMNHCYSDVPLKRIDSLKCSGFVSFMGRDINVVPDELYVDNCLSLDESSDISMPSRLYVGGNLYMRRVFSSNLSIHPMSVIGGFINICGSSAVIISCFINIGVIHNGNLIVEPYDLYQRQYFEDKRVNYGVLITCPIDDGINRPFPYFSDTKFISTLNIFSRESLIDYIVKNNNDDIINYHTEKVCAKYITCAC